ncbi:ABC transporter ATP-binding protein [Halococcus thailandensis]|uniref:Molybdate/tungstate import ATP-binding protein WtpC n=1 Tax=Halococcus thailandensis JCM 13552 TaxID=1227457 RepID=M0N5Z2_9EURY|nr:ABC transporter ATP-binding protein [Halococcus thailandensis]EMA52100.1 ABC transporter ATP-binding protein [Halococcus thailandensis JCM 13552]
MTLVVDGMRRSHGAFELGPIDLAVDEEVLSVLGPSGCGKTTLLSTIAGTVTPDAGTISLGGLDLTGRPPEKRGTVLVFQDGALFPHMTARENVAYAASSEKRVEELADALEIDAVLDQRADTLSGGERQRVALARSLAADPDALLLDEPLANLDAPIKRRLRDELRPLLASLDVPVIYVTHDQREATAIGDRLAVIADGELLQLDTPDEVFAHPATPFVASFTGSTNLFRGAVVETGTGRALDWNGRRLDAAIGGATVGETVQFCIRPEYVTLAADETRNSVEGAITRRVFEGDGYLLDVVPDGGDEAVRLALSPPAYERAGLDERDRVRLALPADAIHVIGGVEECSAIGPARR